MKSLLFGYVKTKHIFSSWILFVFISAGMIFASDIKVTPYGHVELDTIYSGGNTNPLDPDQFNGYVTGAGLGENSSSSFNSRFMLLGLKSEWEKENQKLVTFGEFDFWGSDKVGLTVPRLRLASIHYKIDKTEFVLGQDWTPVMTLHPSVLDFSIMGYGGNLWQRIPQITIKHVFNGKINLTGTVMRFERSSGTGPFDDTMRMPFIGGRVGYTGSNNLLLAISGAYRTGELSGTNKTVVSQLAGIEASLPIGPVTVSGELAQGKALGAEFFRFGQDFVGGNEINTSVGWIDLSYSFKPWSFHTGYGFDDPKDEDLSSVSDTAHYLNNQRTFFNIVYGLSSGLNIGVEYTYVSTKWSNKKDISASQGMLSFFYEF